VSIVRARAVCVLRRKTLSSRIVLTTPHLQCVLQYLTDTRGYGFIGREDGPDVFVHYTAIAGEGYKTLNEGDTVEFEIAQGPKGPQASNVVKLTEHHS
jgi:CspA family cold shock protein